MELSLHSAHGSEKGGELQKESVWAKFAYTASDGKTYQVDYYNLDVVISVGYRVKSSQGTKFRIWATSVLRIYLLQGYSVNRHLIALQENMDKRMTRIEGTQAKQQQQLDFFIRTSTPPAEMVFFEGDFYTARVALENLVRTATRRDTRRSGAMMFRVNPCVTSLWSVGLRRVSVFVTMKKDSFNSCDSWLNPCSWHHPNTFAASRQGHSFGVVPGKSRWPATFAFGKRRRRMVRRSLMRWYWSMVRVFFGRPCSSRPPS